MLDRFFYSKSEFSNEYFVNIRKFIAFVRSRDSTEMNYVRHSLQTQCLHIVQKQSGSEDNL